MKLKHIIIIGVLLILMVYSAGCMGIYFPDISQVSMKSNMNLQQPKPSIIDPNAPPITTVPTTIPVPTTRPKFVYV